jgi:hypothetical protein
MPPLLIRIRVKNAQGRAFNLWIPLFLLWLLLAPFAIVVLPVFLVLSLVLDFDPLRALSTAGGLLVGINGTHVEVDRPDGFVFVHFL